MIPMTAKLGSPTPRHKRTVAMQAARCHNAIMTQFVVALTVIFALGAVPPVRWGIRFLGLLALLLMLVLVTQPTPYDGPGLGYQMMMAAVLWMSLPMLTGVALRGAIALAIPPREPAPAEAMALTGFDGLLQAGFGVLIGCAIFLLLAVLLQGIPGGLTLHVTIAALSLLITAALWRTHLRAVALGAGLLTTALSLDAGLRYPDLIVAEALRRHGEAPRCLMLGPDLSAPASRSDLMALTMAKDRTGPSDVLLLVQYDTGPSLFRWSFRGRSFTQAPSETGMAPLCTPHTTPIAPLP